MTEDTSRLPRWCLGALLSGR